MQYCSNGCSIRLVFVPRSMSIVSVQLTLASYVPRLCTNQFAGSLGTRLTLSHGGYSIHQILWPHAHKTRSLRIMGTKLGNNVPGDYTGAIHTGLLPISHTYTE